MLPPLIFVVINAIWGLVPAVIAAFSLGLILGLNRLIRKQPWQYALGGLLGVGLAAGLALLTRNASSYFIPAMISSGILVIAAVTTNLIGKPLAAWASHLSRGWPLEWFWRKDVKPAYRDVTWFWSAFFTLRLAIQIYLYLENDTGTLGWVNTLLGWPVTIAILVLSYIYGIWRLRRLGGPGVEEFEAKKEPPWQGQTRGF